MNRIKYYIPGTILILSGIFIVIFPEILIAIIASIVILAGMAALLIGKKMSKTENILNNMAENDFQDDSYFNFRERDRSIFKIYRKWF